MNRSTSVLGHAESFTGATAILRGGWNAQNWRPVSPEDWNYLSSYLYFLDRDGREAEIEAALKEAVATGRAPAQAYFTLAANYQNEGALPAAAEIYRKATFAKQLDMDAKRYAKRMEQVIRAMMEQ